MDLKNIKDIINSEDFNLEHNNYIKKSDVVNNKKRLIDILDNIETNKKYYRMGIQKNRRYKKETTVDTNCIKKITGDINKLSELNYDTLKPKIINQIKVDYIIPYVIEILIDKSIIHRNYIPLYVGIIKDIPFQSKYKLIIKLCDSYHSKFFKKKIIEGDGSFYQNLCAENKNIDNIIGFSLLITNLEKENIINGYVNKILEPFMDSILDTNDDSDIFKMITSFYNISRIHFDRDIPKEYVIILNKLKEKTTSSKIRFKIMDILDE